MHVSEHTARGRGLARYVWRFLAGYVALCLLILVGMLAVVVASGDIETTGPGRYALRNTEGVELGLFGMVLPSLLACLWPVRRFVQDHGRIPSPEESRRMVRWSIAASALVWLPALVLVATPVMQEGANWLVLLVVVIPFAIHAWAVRFAYRVSMGVTGDVRRRLGPARTPRTAPAQTPAEIDRTSSPGSPDA